MARIFGACCVSRGTSAVVWDGRVGSCCSSLMRGSLWMGPSAAAEVRLRFFEGVGMDSCLSCCVEERVALAIFTRRVCSPFPFPPTLTFFPFNLRHPQHRLRPAPLPPLVARLHARSHSSSLQSPAALASRKRTRRFHSPDKKARIRVLRQMADIHQHTHLPPQPPRVSRTTKPTRRGRGQAA